MILGKQVLLKEDYDNDHEKNSAYVYLKNKIFINTYLIKSGMAVADSTVNHKLNKKFIKLEEQRRKVKAERADFDRPETEVERSSTIKFKKISGG
jgi:endonuclease YncB( thermonuclease family)